MTDGWGFDQYTHPLDVPANLRQNSELPVSLNQLVEDLKASQVPDTPIGRQRRTVQRLLVAMEEVRVRIAVRVRVI